MESPSLGDLEIALKESITRIDQLQGEYKKLTGKSYVRPFYLSEQPRYHTLLKTRTEEAVGDHVEALLDVAIELAETVGGDAPIFLDRLGNILSSDDVEELASLIEAREAKEARRQMQTASYPKLFQSDIPN